jgi:AcrR family transcriptional regulator
LKQLILDASVMLAARVGFRHVTRKLVADKVGCALATVSYHYLTMDKLHDATMRRAIELRLPLIVAQGLAEGHKDARNAPYTLRNAAAKLIAA